MLLRLLAILFFSAALVIGLTLGWGRDLGSMLGIVNSGWAPAIESGFGPAMRDALMRPLLSIPAWAASAAIGMMFLLASAMRPGRG